MKSKRQLKTENKLLKDKSKYYYKKFIEMYEKYKPETPTSNVEYFKDKRKEHRFRIKAFNNKILMVSQGYKTKQGAEKGFNTLKQALINPGVEE